VYVGAAAALSPFGAGWHGLAAFVRGGRRPAALEVPPLDAGDEPCEPRHRKMMSRAAYLAAAVIKRAARELALPNPVGVSVGDSLAPVDAPAVGLYMGVGASGGDMAELEAMLRASVADGAFALDRFGVQGLTAVNPLFAFQLMNNYTLCQGAILAGLDGPNGAFFSRGAGTVTALREAAFAVASGDAAAALAGGADSALHPVTAAELARGGWIARGLLPAEAAAVIALGTAPADAAGRPRPRLVRAEVHVARAGSLADAAAAALAGAGDASPSGGGAATAVVLCPWGPPAGAALAEAAARTGAEILDAGAALGEALAAAPALGWAVACDWLSQPGRQRGRAIVLSAGIDGELGVVEMVA
jgi:hypothetical protein